MIPVPKKQGTTRWRDFQSADHTSPLPRPNTRGRRGLVWQTGPASPRFPPCVSVDSIGTRKSWRIQGHQFPDTYLVHKVGHFSHFLESTRGYWCVSLRPTPMILLLLKHNKSRQQCLCVQKKPPGFLHGCRAGQSPSLCSFSPWSWPFSPFWLLPSCRERWILTGPGRVVLFPWQRQFTFCRYISGHLGHWLNEGSQGSVCCSAWPKITWHATACPGLPGCQLSALALSSR